MSRFPPPFPPALEVDTEPGLGLLALKNENARLRQERDDLRAALSESDSVPPPPTRRQRRAKVALVAGGSAGAAMALYPIVRLLCAALAKKWPELQPVVDFLLPVLSP